jgi:hypothetical protein
VTLVLSLLICAACCVMLYYGYSFGMAEIVLFRTEAERRNAVRFLLIAGAMLVVLVASLGT